MDRISGEEIARVWHEDSGSGSEHDEAPANMIDFFPADEVQAEIDELKRCLKHLLYGDPSGKGTQATITEWAKELLQDKGE